MSIQIPCPQCHRELKLPDRSLLGRKGKCPKCGHTFILEEPSAPAFEFSDTKSGSSQLTSEPDVPPIPDFLTSRTAPAIRETPASDAAPDFTALERETSSKGTASRLKQHQKKNARRRNAGLAIAAIIFAAVGGVMVFAPPFAAKNVPTATEPPNKAETASTESTATSDAATDADGIDPATTSYAKLGSPTKGKPIDLQYIPFGTQVIINLHPAELWKEASLGKEIRFCVPPVAKLIETTLDDLFKRKPEQVEELMICLIPGVRGTPPDVAAVAHLVEEQKQNQLAEQFGQRVDTYSQPVYVSKNRAYLIANQKTLVVCPQSQMQEMVQAITERHPSEQLDPLLPMTDRDRHVTVLFMPLTLGLQDSWFPENFRPFVRNAIDWLGDEIESMSYSFHLTDDLFYSDLLVRHRGVAAKVFERDFKQKLSKLAETLVPLIQQMNPKEQGKRMVIGRVPAMVEVFSMATIANHGKHHVQFITPLPDRAAANIVLGTLLAWDESTRTDFTKVKPTSTEATGVPALVADRLKMKIEVDFRRTPLNEAFSFIGGEIKTPIEVDGDSLKAGGFTKNIVQTFQMESARAQDVIVKIFQDSKSIETDPERTLVLVVDEAKKQILVTTLGPATRRGLKPFDLK